MTTHRKHIRFFAALILLVTAFSSAFVSRAASNEETIFNYLTKKIGYNSAAACGILANIERESAFRPTIYGDGGTSYGICQWHDVSTGVGRFTNLKNFCAQNKLDYTTLEGQLAFLAHELSSLRTINNYLLSVADTEQGAYDAGYYWCYNFEIPGDRENQSKLRGELARTKYWPLFGSRKETPPASPYEVWKTKSSLTLRSGAGKSYDAAGTVGEGRQLYITRIATDKDNAAWGYTGSGWCELKSCEWVSGALYTLRFVTNCATVIADAAVHYKQSYKLPSAADVTKYGYKLSGWDLGSTAISDPGAAVTVYGDLTAKAVWTRDKSVALLRGDANSDGKVNSRDVTMVMKQILGQSEAICLPSADAFADGKINARDVTLIMTMVTGSSKAARTVSAAEEKIWS